MKLVLKDGKVIESENKTGLEIAESISLSLAKKVVAYRLDNVLYDMRTRPSHDGNFTLITQDDKESLDVLNHSTSHLLAEAIHNLYPQALFGFGPAIEEGFYYDIDFKDEVINEEVFPKIEKEMMRIASSGLKIIREVVTKEEALEIFKDNPYKIELINGIEGEITIYTQGDFCDLCAGPHVDSVSKIRHFKLLSLSGAYWRGDIHNPQLTRIYGTSFWSGEDLKKHLEILEERKKRDHRKIGKELGLFMFSEYGPGFPFWLPKGYDLKRRLEDFWLQIHRDNDYVIIQTPMMLSKELWEISGHWFNYKENMYTSTIDEKEFAIKPMNCPGGMLVYKNSIHSYRDFPLRVGELGQVHRHEASGALSGLFRVRTFTQDDAHIFIRKDQIQEEVVNLLKLFDQIYSIFGLDYHIELSTRPEKKYIGDIEIWNESEAALASACKASNKEFIINPGDGAFYGPKLDFKLRDSMNRIWQCGTIQLDMNLPERFDLTYIDSDGTKKRPVMLHRAIFGSVERFLGILIENFAGALPTWLFPTQVMLLPVATDTQKNYASNLVHKFKEYGIRAEVDLREEKLGYRLRDAQMQKIPYSIVIGDEEMKNNTLTYRLYGHKEQINVSFDAFLKMILEEINTKALRK